MNKILVGRLLILLCLLSSSFFCTIILFENNIHDLVTNYPLLRELAIAMMGYIFVPAGGVLIIWMLRALGADKELENRSAWVLSIFFLNWIGASIFFLFVYSRKNHHR